MLLGNNGRAIQWSPEAGSCQRRLSSPISQFRALGEEPGSLHWFSRSGKFENIALRKSKASKEGKLGRAEGRMEKGESGGEEENRRARAVEGAHAQKTSF